MPRAEIYSPFLGVKVRDMPKSASKRVGDQEVQMDRRRKERRDKVAETAVATVDKLEQQMSDVRKVQRRRQIDPTTCEREYTDPEIQFMQALDNYKRSSGRMFPTCSEILEVIRGLGYVQLSEEERGVLNSLHEAHRELLNATEPSDQNNPA